MEEKKKDTVRNGHEYILIYHNGSARGVTQEERSSGTLNLKDKKGNYKKGRELRKWGGTSLREDREGQWFLLKTPHGEIVFPYRNYGKQGHWRWGEKQKMKPVIDDPDYAHWELCPYDDGVVVNNQTERWVPFEKIRDSKKMVGWTTWLNSVGFNSDGTAKLKEIFGTKLFDTPKPVSLIEWLISLHNDENATVLDSFAGSGTTAHAVLNLNSNDEGNRKFILIEMEDYANDITAERVMRVINGYGATEGTGGSFDFYELGQPMFLEDGNLNELAGVEKIRQYVYYTETKTPLTETKHQDNKHFLGKNNDTAYYFNYEQDEVTTLDHAFLATMKTKSEQYVIYADNCLLTKDFMTKHHIIFKKIPRDITRF